METERMCGDTLDRLLRLAAAMGDTGADTTAIDRQVGLYLDREIGRRAHMVPSGGTDTPPMWRRNMDYAPEENSPHFGSASEFLRRFPGGIAEWREWRDRSRRRRERQWKLSTMLAGVDKTAGAKPAGDDGGLEAFLKEAWEWETSGSPLAHLVPEGGDDVAKLGDKEPKIWSDDPKWRSIGEFLEAHREHYGQDADDAALRAARDFVRYWKLTAKEPEGARGR
jgi:hypothetical protein